MLKLIQKLTKRPLPARFEIGDDLPSYVPPDGTPPPDPFHAPAWQEPIQKWLEQLPEVTRPVHLNGNFPRVAAKLMSNWPDRRATKAYLVELLVDRRGGRKGFPSQVQAELRRLQDYLTPYEQEPAIRTHPL